MPTPNGQPTPAEETRDKTRNCILDAIDVRRVCMRYGFVKSAMLQGLRNVVGGGVCNAIVRHWLAANLQVSEAERRKQKQKIRQEFKQLPPAMPQYLLDDQVALKDIWGKQPEKLDCLILTNIASGHLTKIMRGAPHPMTGSLAYAVNSQSRPGAAYFLLRLSGHKS